MIYTLSKLLITSLLIVAIAEIAKRSSFIGALLASLSLMANMIILHNVQQMTQILKNLQNDDYALSDAVLSGLAPYRRQHINRFGGYSLDLDREI